CQQDFGWPLTF
nr:immunoglobulin light chain junction region [Macaca mulatta]